MGQGMSEFFSRLERGAWGGFISTQSKIFRKIEEDLQSRFGISHSEFEVLLRLFLSQENKVRIQELAAKSLLSHSGTSRLVDRLVRAGHVIRAGAVEDRRGAYAVLTSSGRDFFRKVAIEHTALVRREFLAHYSEAELEVMAEFWSRLETGGEGVREGIVVLNRHF